MRADQKGPTLLKCSDGCRKSASHRLYCFFATALMGLGKDRYVSQNLGVVEDFIERFGSARRYISINLGNDVVESSRLCIGFNLAIPSFPQHITKALNKLILLVSGKVPDGRFHFLHRTHIFNIPSETLCVKPLFAPNVTVHARLQAVAWNGLLARLL